MAFTHRTLVRSLALAAGSALLGLAAHAATPAGGGGCNPDEARNDPAACKRESGAAALEAKRGNLTTPSADAKADHQDDRCKNLTGAQARDCLARSGGGGSARSTTTTTGSVQSGGVVRETVTTIPAR